MPDLALPPGAAAGAAVLAAVALAFAYDTVTTWLEPLLDTTVPIAFVALFLLVALLSASTASPGLAAASSSRAAGAGHGAAPGGQQLSPAASLQHFWQWRQQ